MMRLAIITRGLSPIVRPLVDSQHDVVVIVEAEPRGGAQITHRRLRRRVSSLLSIILPHRINLEQYAHRGKIPYFRLGEESIESFGAWLSDFSPDLLVVFSMSNLLPRSVFAIPRLGTINLHPSYLPEYRGPNPEFWQYRDFCADGSATVHFIDEGEDTGDIIHQDRVPVAPGTRSPDWNRRVIGELGIDLLMKAVDDLASGQAPRRQQPRQSPTVRARRIKASEHSEIIDWDTWSIEHVWHVLRGTESWLKSIAQPSGLLTGQLWSVGHYDHGSPSGKAGTVQRDKQGYFIACRDGSIRISVRFSVKRWIRNLLPKP